MASDPIAGETRRINATTLVVELSQSLPVFTNVKLLFTFYQGAHCFSDIYAKVMERVESDHQPAYRLHVTYMDQHDAKVLERWVRAAAPNPPAAADSSTHSPADPAREEATGVAVGR